MGRQPVLCRTILITLGKRLAREGSGLRPPLGGRVRVPRPDGVRHRSERLYGLYAEREHLSHITLTIVYAVYAVGVVASLVLAGHVSDTYGRRTVLIPGLLVAGAAAVVFLA